MRKKEPRSPRSVKKSDLEKVQEQLAEVMATMKAQQDALLISISKQAGVPMELVSVVEAIPEPPATLESLKLELADNFLEAWCQVNNPNNSRQAAVVARMSTPKMQKLLKTILDWKK